ncbi:hypothetical protein [Thomasclavelia sp.]|uniref:hypothetical protein n=1 Tax=Thomasclavelia sp. TaxID=3025757 RepID=UPI0025D7B67D|nr:hypothetical protein [Thomasclavelia sp.]
MEPRAYNNIYRSGLELSKLRETEVIFLEYQDQIIARVNDIWHEKFDDFINQLIYWKNKYIYNNVGMVADKNDIHRNEYFEFIKSENGEIIKK